MAAPMLGAKSSLQADTDSLINLHSAAGFRADRFMSRLQAVGAQPAAARKLHVAPGKVCTGGTVITMARRATAGAGPTFARAMPRSRAAVSARQRRLRARRD